MSTELRALCLFDGVLQIEGASFTLSHGVTPSVAQLTIIPQVAPAIPLDGTLTWTFGGVVMLFPGCRVDKANFEYTQSGLVWRLSIWDRRWKWAFGAISGAYNVRHPNVGDAGLPAAQALAQQPVAPAFAGVPPLQLGTLDINTLATPQQLATLCFLAMGETVFDVSQLPNDSRPEIQWDNDSPAQALSNLCDLLGCRVALGIDNVARIVRLGVGALLPRLAIEAESAAIDPAEVPSSLTITGGKARYQVDFQLEAVGLDINGIVRPIDQLSYTPAEGWTKTEKIFFGAVAGFEQNPLLAPNQNQVLALGYINPRQLALATVYRWYRIKMADIQNPRKPPLIPGWAGGRISFLWQVLPIEDVQIEGYYDEFRVFRPYPAWVFGQFLDYGLPPGNTQPGSFCHFDFTIDRERGIVQFAEQVFFQNADFTLAPALLGLRCAVSVRDAATRTWDRFQKTYPLSNATASTSTRVVKREDIFQNVVPNYDVNHKVVGLRTNLKETNQESDYQAVAASFVYQLNIPDDITYMGIVPINPDGAIWQVTWETGPSGATTRASRNTEWNPAIPTYRERRLAESVVRNTPTIQILQNQARRE